MSFRWRSVYYFAFASWLPSLIFLQKSIAVTLLFTSIIMIRQFILIDLWLAEKSIFTHFYLLKTDLLLIFFPFILHPFIIYHPFFQNIFSVTSLSFWYIISSILYLFLFLFLWNYLKNTREFSLP